ncbi:MAG: CPBP family intramembrane metalloprotease [Verrucomicrobia bacterium]|nr:CPBP family intramembrane metalloprotease [Verrucomicrobiota bacterium]MCH8528412.1 CPBP family intramembrane metalloprotease [Kiritimatiellia bacterium]
MSILIQPGSWRNRQDPVQAAWWFGFYVVAALVGGAFLGAFLVRYGLSQEEGFVSSLVENHGGSRITRRIQTVVAVLLGPWMLKQIGWQGLSDLGWDNPQRSAEAQRRDAYRGFALGLISVGGIFALAMISGARAWEPFSLGSWIGSILSGFLITGIGVGILEETLTRGVLYRSMARCWGAWTGAVVSSLIFAYAHFLKASPESFEAGVFAAVQSSFLDGLRMEQFGFLKLLNMFLFGILLCRMVARRGDIWYAVGLHASAVGLIKVISRQTTIAEIPRSAWFGHSAKFDDGWLLTLVLMVMIVVVDSVRSPSRESSRVHF